MRSSIKQPSPAFTPGFTPTTGQPGLGQQQGDDTSIQVAQHAQHGMEVAVVQPRWPSPFASKEAQATEAEHSSCGPLPTLTPIQAFPCLSPLAAVASGSAVAQQQQQQQQQQHCRVVPPAKLAVYSEQLSEEHSYSYSSLKGFGLPHCSAVCDKAPSSPALIVLASTTTVPSSVTQSMTRPSQPDDCSRQSSHIDSAKSLVGSFSMTPPSGKHVHCPPSAICAAQGKGPLKGLRSFGQSALSLALPAAAARYFSQGNNKACREEVRNAAVTKLGRAHTHAPGIAELNKGHVAAPMVSMRLQPVSVVSSGSSDQGNSRREWIGEHGSGHGFVGSARGRCDAAATAQHAQRVQGASAAAWKAPQARTGSGKVADSSASLDSGTPTLLQHTSSGVAFSHHAKHQAEERKQGLQALQGVQSGQSLRRVLAEEAAQDHVHVHGKEQGQVRSVRQSQQLKLPEPTQDGDRQSDPVMHSQRMRPEPQEANRQTEAVRPLQQLRLAEQLRKGNRPPSPFAARAAHAGKRHESPFAARDLQAGGRSVSPFAARELQAGGRSVSPFAARELQAGGRSVSPFAAHELHQVDRHESPFAARAVQATGRSVSPFAACDLQAIDRHESPSAARSGSHFQDTEGTSTAAAKQTLPEILAQQVPQKPSDSHNPTKGDIAVATHQHNQASRVGDAPSDLYPTAAELSAARQQRIKAGRAILEGARHGPGSKATADKVPMDDLTLSLWACVADADSWEIELDELEVHQGQRLGFAPAGTVLKATWRGITEVAAKLLRTNIPRELFAFRSQASVMTRLRHPNILQLLGMVVQPPTTYIVSEKMQRGAVYQLLHRTDPGGATMLPSHRLAVALDCARALCYMHSSRPPIMHLDVKTPNLFMDERGTVKLGGMWLSRPVGDRPLSTARLPSMSALNSPSGSPNDSSPSNSSPSNSSPSNSSTYNSSPGDSSANNSSPNNSSESLSVVPSSTEPVSISSRLQTTTTGGLSTASRAVSGMFASAVSSIAGKSGAAMNSTITGPPTTVGGTTAGWKTATHSASAESTVASDFLQPKSLTSPRPTAQPTIHTTGDAKATLASSSSTASHLSESAAYHHPVELYEWDDWWPTALRINTSAEWMSPEALRASRTEPLNEKSDVYSFGVVLWELCTNDIPWASVKQPTVVSYIVGMRGERLPLPDDVDPALKQLIKDCWEEEPSKRPSMAEVYQRLSGMQEIVPSQACQVSRMTREHALRQTPDQDPMALLASLQMNPWQICKEDLIRGKRLGVGAFGEVFHGWWHHSTEVAIKVLLEQDLCPNDLLAFKHEVSLMSKLRHPNVVQFLGAVLEPFNLAIITEYMPAGSLFQMLHRYNKPKVDGKRRLKMAQDVAKGLLYLHSHKPAICHRDLKSPNLLCDRDGTVKLADFGLSRVKAATFVTGKGTPAWMAPEALREGICDERSDVFSYGVVLWELATGEVPWKGLAHPDALPFLVANGQRLDVPEDIDPVIRSIILDCWHEVPSKRPTCGQILKRLATVKEITPSLAQARSSSSSAGFSR